jgi:hypothetical protein
MLRAARLLPIFAIVLLHASLARAERPRRPSVRLEYERKKGAESCPDEASLRAHIAAQIGRDPFTSEGSWRMVASVARRGAGFVANMEAFENDGKTWSPGPIADPSCARLVNEILALSIAIELSEPPPEPPPAASPVVVPAPPIVATAPPADEPRAPAESSPAPRDPDALRLRLAFGAGVELGVGATPSPVFSLNVGVRWPIVSVALEARTDLPLTGTGEGGVAVQTHVVAGSMLGCLHARSLYAYGCGLLALGVQRGGDARSPSSYPSTAYAAAGGRVGLELPFASRFALSIAGDVLAALNPMGIRSNLTTVWEAAPVAGAAQAGLVTFF